MGIVSHSEDLATVVRDLQRQVRELRRRSLFNATISSGATEVRTPDGEVVVRIGEIVADGRTGHGMEIFRHNGTVQGRFYDTADGSGSWTLFDEAGNPIVAEDANAGTGLARPLIPYSWTRWADLDDPPLTTGSATYELLARIHGPKQHARITVQLFTDADTDTVGEIILTDAGIQAGPTVYVEPGGVYQLLAADLSGDHETWKRLDVQGRVTGGPGSIKAAICHISGTPSTT